MNCTRNLESFSYDERRQIPVVINNFNRLGMLKGLVGRLRDVGLNNIIILDNASTYPPLLDYYVSVPANVVRLGRNIGYLALWESAFSESLGSQPFIYTDPDVVPDEQCPDDFIDVLFDCLMRHPQLDKVGLALRLDDLPPSLPLTRQIQEHESAFWKRRLAPNLFQAPVDTTLALYRPGRCGGYWLNGGRTAPPYMARHLPWYLNPAHLDEEEIFYRSLAKTTTHWTSAT